MPGDEVDGKHEGPRPTVGAPVGKQLMKEVLLAAEVARIGDIFKVFRKLSLTYMNENLDDSKDSLRMFYEKMLKLIHLTFSEGQQRSAFVDLLNTEYAKAQESVKEKDA